MTSNYRIEELPNGMTRVDHRGSGLVALYDTKTGAFLHGQRFASLLKNLPQDYRTVEQANASITAASRKRSY